MKALFLGDLSPTEVTATLLKNGDIETVFSDTAELFGENDFNFVNLECALTDSTSQIKKFGPALAMPPKAAETMKRLGVNYCGLSNNHFFDFEIKGAMDSLEALDRVGIGYTGFEKNYEDSRKNLILEKNGEKYV